MFKRLKEAIESRMITAENAEQMAVLPKDVLNIQLIQELQQQRNELNYRGEGRLLGLNIHRGALTQQQSPPTIDQEMDKIIG